MTSSGVGNVFIDGIMDETKYLKILQENLRDSVSKLNLSSNYWFQSDNDLKHTAKIVKEWVLYNVLHVSLHPPQNPDLNIVPIEHLRDEVEKGLRNTLLL